MAFFPEGKEPARGKGAGFPVHRPVKEDQFYTMIGEFLPQGWNEICERSYPVSYTHLTLPTTPYV